MMGESINRSTQVRPSAQGVQVVRPQADLERERHGFEHDRPLGRRQSPIQVPRDQDSSGSEQRPVHNLEIQVVDGEGLLGRSWQRDQPQHVGRPA